MRRYNVATQRRQEALLRAAEASEWSAPAFEARPGMTLTETIDQFFVEGVVPDLLPADLGSDETSEVTFDGWPVVDPLGDIRTDPMELRERQLVKASDDKFVQQYAGTKLDEDGFALGDGNAEVK